MAPIPAIRLAVPEDAAALAVLKRTTFRETFVEGFAIPYPPADMARFEEESYGLAQVAAELADPDHATWVVAGEDGALVAYAHAGPCKLPHADVRAGEVELYQLYMLRDLKGGGLGRMLMERALGWMEGRGPATGGGRPWLGVWSGNQRAQRFYARFGFAQVGTYDFAVGDHRDHEFIWRRG
ncbi:MAG TPA: GNAT family N-acetyltransferase [Sphingobium sp.]